MEYQFEGFDGGKFVCRAYSYPTLKTVRADAKSWTGEKPGRTAIILKLKPRRAGHEFGAEWQKIEVVGVAQA